jgi:hypothetical protein
LGTHLRRASKQLGQWAPFRGNQLICGLNDSAGVDTDLDGDILDFR